MKQLVHIHGAEAFTHYKDALAYLRNDTMDNPFEEKIRGWKHTLADSLEDTFEVALISMPNSRNAQYDEWKIWFEKLFPFLRENVVFIGHSLGAMFLVKYLSENTLPVSISALFLVAPAFEKDTSSDEDGGDFYAEPKNLSRIAEQCGHIAIFHSQDDPVVPFADAEKFKEALPSAELIVFEDRGHFLQEEFPELIENIRQT